MCRVSRGRLFLVQVFFRALAGLSSTPDKQTNLRSHCISVVLLHQRVIGLHRVRQQRARHHCARRHLRKNSSTQSSPKYPFVLSGGSFGSNVVAPEVHFLSGVIARIYVYIGPSRHVALRVRSPNSTPRLFVKGVAQNSSMGAASSSFAFSTTSARASPTRTKSLCPMRKSPRSTRTTGPRPRSLYGVGRNGLRGRAIE